MGKRDSLRVIFDSKLATRVARVTESSRYENVVLEPGFKDALFEYALPHGLASQAAGITRFVDECGGSVLGEPKYGSAHVTFADAGEGAYTCAYTYEGVLESEKLEFADKVDMVADGGGGGDGAAVNQDAGTQVSAEGSRRQTQGGDADPARGVDPTDSGNFALRSAAANGHFDVVQMLLALDPARGVDPSANENDAVRSAAKHGHDDVVQLLLELPLALGVDPAANDNFALRYAAYYGYPDMVRLLLELPPARGVDPAAQNNFALLMATENGHGEVVDQLMQALYTIEVVV